MRRKRVREDQAERLLQQVKQQTPQLKKTGPSGWYSIDICPAPACGYSRSLAFHPRKGYKCHHCGESGPIQLFPSWLRKQGIHVDDLGSLVLATPKGLKETADRIGQRIVERLGCRQENQTELSGEKHQVDLPEEARPVLPNFCPLYLFVDRRLPIDLLLRVNAHWCETGRYRDYAVFPVSTNGLSSWQAINIKRENGRPKDLNPEELLMGQFLYLYDEAFSDLYFDSVVLVEGIFDAIRAWDHHLVDRQLPFPLALLGSELSDAQGALLLKLKTKGVRRFYVGLDAVTAGPWAQKQARLMANWVGQKMMRLCHLESTPWGDPDEVMNVEDWQTVIHEATHVRGLLRGRASGS